MEISIRKAVPGDFPEVYKLICELWKYQNLEEEDILERFIRKINDPTELLLVAMIEGVAVGYSSCAVMKGYHLEKNWAYLNILVVTERLRRKGIGQMLLDATISLAKMRGCREIKLDSGFHRIDAHKFYGKNGFSRNGMSFFKAIE